MADGYGFRRPHFHPAHRRRVAPATAVPPPPVPVTDEAAPIPGLVAQQLAARHAGRVATLAASFALALGGGADAMAQLPEGSEDSGPLPQIVAAPPAVMYLASGDEIVEQAPAPIFAEDLFLPPRPPEYRPTLYLPPAPDEIARITVQEDEDGQTLHVAPGVAYVPDPWQDEALPIAPPATIVEDDAGPVLHTAHARTHVPDPWQDDPLPIAPAATIVEDEAGPVLYAAPGRAHVPDPWAAEVLPEQAVGSAPPEESVGALVFTIPVTAVSLPGGGGSATPVSGTVDEDHQPDIYVVWQPTPTVFMYGGETLTPTWLREDTPPDPVVIRPRPFVHVFVDDEVLPGAVAPTIVAEETGFVLHVASARPSVTVFDADEVLPITPPATIVDEDAAPTFTVERSAPHVPHPWADEALPIAPAPTIVDEEAGPVLPHVTRTVVVWPFLADHEVAPQPTTMVTEEGEATIFVVRGDTGPAIFAAMIGVDEGVTTVLSPASRHALGPDDTYRYLGSDDTGRYLGSDDTYRYLGST